MQIAQDVSVIYLQLLSIPYHIGRNAGCRNAGQTIAQNISLINSTDLCQKALAFSTQCHTIERRTNEKKTGRIELRNSPEIICTSSLSKFA